MNAVDFAQKLDKWRREGSGFVACCPAHDDSLPSLSIHDGNNGAVLLHCHAGCSFEDIVAAAGYKPRDLMPPSDLSPGELRRYRVIKSRAQLEEPLVTELHVLLQILTARAASRELAKDPSIKILRPEMQPYPTAVWDRERQAVKRIISALQTLY